MKKLAIFLLVVTSLSGCIAYPVPYDNGPGYRNHNRDRDGDGVRNRDDRRPNNPNRY